MTNSSTHRTGPTGADDRLASTSPRRAGHARESSSPSPPETAARKNSWPVAATVLVLALLLLIAMFWRTGASLVETWYASDTYGHGFLILPVCGYLLWRRRHVMARETPAPCLWAIAAMGVGALAWRLGDAAAALVVQQFALVAMLQTLFVAVLGPRIVRKIAFPLLYLYLAVPFGAFLVTPLQDLTARFVSGALVLTGVPVYLDGFFIDIPAARFNVAEACAGVRFLLASIAVGILGAHLFYRSWARRCLFIVAAVIVPIIANGLRAYGIVMVAHLSGSGLAGRVDHVTYGFVFLSFVMLILLGVGKLLREQDVFDRSAGADALGAKAGAARIGRPAPSLAAYAGAAAGALLIAAGSTAVGAVGARVDRGNGPVDLAVPAARAPWKPEQRTGMVWRPVFPGADAELTQSYSSGTREVAVYLAYYRYERQGAEVVNEQNRFADGRAWTEVGRGTTQLILCRDPQTVHYVRLLSGAHERVVVFWYWVDGRFMSNPYVAKLMRVRGRLLGGIDAAAVVAVATDHEGGRAEGEAVIQDFLGHVEPLGALLERLANEPDGADGRNGAAASDCSRG